MSIIMTILGVFGAILVTLMYVLLERGVVNAQSLYFYALNGLGGVLILLSLIYDFDMADMGGVVMEGSWIVVSIMGICKALKQKKAQ